ncbi:hypothetical protein E4U54_006455, partial [Claviceps lovelessii]
MSVSANGHGHGLVPNFEPVRLSQMPAKIQRLAGKVRPMTCRVVPNEHELQKCGSAEV